MPCPPGTFRPEEAGTSHSCLTCPVDFFNPMPGQKACLPCSSEAAQPAEGQETCICLGKGQVFQVKKQSCKSSSVLRHSTVTSGFDLHCLTSCTALIQRLSLWHWQLSVLHLISNYTEPLAWKHHTRFTHALSFRAAPIFLLCGKVKGMCTDTKVSSDLSQIRLNA